MDVKHTPLSAGKSGIKHTKSQHKHTDAKGKKSKSPSPSPVKPKSKRCKPHGKHNKPIRIIKTRLSITKKASPSKSSLSFTESSIGSASQSPQQPQSQQLSRDDAVLVSSPDHVSPSFAQSGNNSSITGTPIQASEPSVDGSNASTDSCWTSSSNETSSDDSVFETDASSRSTSTSTEDSKMEEDSEEFEPIPTKCAYDPTTMCFIPNDVFDKLPKKVKASTKRANKNNPCGYTNHCLCCGVWFKDTHTCKNTNRPAKLGKYTFKVPKNIFESYKGSKANEPNESRDQSVDDKFVKPSNWDFSFFTTIAPEKIFSSPGTIQSLHKDTQNAFSLLVKDIIPLVLKKKPGAIEALFLLPRLVAPSNLRGRTATSKILEFISLFRTGQFVPLWERPNIVLRYGSYNPVKRAIALAKAGNLGDAIRALASEGVMHPKECLDILMTLHPQAPPPAPPAPVSPGNLTQPFNKADFQYVVKHAKWKKAADALGWRMDHIKILNKEALNMLFVFCLKLAKDPELIPERLRPFFFGARLTPIRKKDGGVRPIAIGTIFHKLVSSAIMSHLKEELMVFFPPVQFGVAIPGGAENVVHGVRNCLFNDPESILVSLDLKNAFNSVNRDAFIQAVREKFPSALCWTYQSYGQPSKLTMRGCEPIDSSAGVRQGDPMGPFLFCLAIQPALQKINGMVKSLTYMDDIYLVGHEEDMRNALATLEQELSALSLSINLSKSWSHKQINNLTMPIPVNPDPVVMKVPLYCTTPITQLKEKVSKSIDEIANIDNVQIALLLLRHINNGSLTYTLRTSPKQATKELIAALEQGVKSTLAKVLECSEDKIEAAKDRIHMPIGPGLGFTSLPDIAEPAFLASLLQATLRLERLSQGKLSKPILSDALDIGDENNVLYADLLSLAFEKEHLLVEDPGLKLQHTLVEQTKSERFNKVYDSLSDLQKTIVDSTNDTHASGWLTAIPTTPELSISSEDMSVAVKTFLGIPLIDVQQICTCSKKNGKHSEYCFANKHKCKFCKDGIDDFDEHALKCSVKGPLMQRHDSIKKCVCDLCEAGGLYVDVEPSIFGFKKMKRTNKNQSRRKKNQKRPDFVTHLFGKNGASLASDVSVAYPRQKSLPPHPKPLAAAENREKQKNRKYFKDCHKKKYIFHPFVMDAYGGIPSKSFSYVFKPLVRRIEGYQPVNWAAPTAETYWLQRLSLTLWKGNAFKIRYLTDMYV